MEKYIREVNYLGILTRVPLCHSEGIIFLQAINEAQEKFITEYKYINLQFPDGNKVCIDGHNIILYGVINFANPNDVAELEKSNFVDNPLNEIRSWIPTTFNYEKGTAISENGGVKGYHTSNPVLWFKYCHTLIGKPERIIVYRYEDLLRKRYKR